MGAHWHYRRETNGVIKFRIDRVGAWLIERIVRPADKVVSPKWLMSLTESQLREFIRVSMLADGHEPVNGPPVIGQKVLERLRSFEVACALIGQATNTRQVPGGWATTLLKSAGANPKANAARGDKAWRSVYEHQTYTGLIWCPTTPNGTWLARRRGSVYFTGNSQPPYPYFQPGWKDATPVIGRVYRDAWAEALT